MEKVETKAHPHNKDVEVHPEKKKSDDKHPDKGKEDEKEEHHPH